MDQLSAFLNTIWPEFPEGLHLPIFTIPANRTFWCETTDEAAQVARQQCETSDVYLAVSLQDRAAAFAAAGKNSTRGVSTTARALPGLICEIDVLGPNHKADNLCPSFDEARKLICGMGLAPSLIVNSGGGLQAWWLFKEPWLLHEEEEWRRAAALFGGWVKTAQSHAAAHGWKVDSTSYLAQVLRVAGTYNRKREPVLITAEFFEHRYNPSDFDEHLHIVIPADRMDRNRQQEAQPADEADLYTATRCMECLKPQRADDYDTWIRVGMALKSLGHDETTFRLWDRFSAKSAKYDVAQTREKWLTFQAGGVGIGSLLYWAREDSGHRPIEALTAWQMQPPTGNPIVKPPVPTMPRVAPGARQIVANVFDNKTAGPDGDEKNVVQHRTLENVYQQLADATGSWPRRAGGVLFVAREDVEDRLPTHRDVTWLSNTDKLFAWLQRVANIRWTTKSASDPISGRPLTPATKKEFFEYLIHYAEPSYDGVEVLPHHPPLAQQFYLQCRLPAISLVNGPLDQFIDRFNAESQIDQTLLVTALMTPGWGGPPGSRPVFLFTSDHGRGVGKSVTASAFADIWGGAIGIGANEDWDQVKKRLLGDDALGKRCICIDNVKQRLTGGDVEGMITATSIDGWKPYHGQASRPNYLTWYITANSPMLSKDLADRAVVIKLGKQKPGEDFLGWSRQHIEKYRMEIVAGLLELLKQDPAGEVAPQYRDRWAAWHDGVLCKFPSANELAKTIVERRSGVDGDQDDAEDVAAAVIELIEKTYPDYAQRRIFVSRQQLYQHLLKKGLIGREMSARGCTTWVRGMAKSGPLHFLSEHKSVGERGWLFVGEGANGYTKLDVISDDAADHYGWNR